MERFQLRSAVQGDLGPPWSRQEAQVSPPVCFPGGEAQQGCPVSIFCGYRGRGGTAAKLCPAEESPSTKQN